MSLWRHFIPATGSTLGIVGATIGIKVKYVGVKSNIIIMNGLIVKMARQYIGITIPVF